MAKKNTPNMFTTVTPFSKALAMTLFILFPILGFCLGIQYQKAFDLQQQIVINKNIPTLSITPDQKNPAMTTCTQDADCTLTPSDNVNTNNAMALCCGLNSCKAAAQVMAVNNSWLAQRKTNICGKGMRACPMLRVYCPTPIQSTPQQAKCISNTCHVVNS